MSSKIKRDPSITPQQRMVIDIIHTANWVDEKMSRVLKDYGITHPQFNILKNVQAAYPEPLSVKEIRDTTMFSGSDVTRLIDRLVNKGLLCRNTCKINRRKVDINITSKGTDILTKINPELRNEFDDFFDNQISDNDAFKTSEILRLVRSSS
jgi:MarR family transcriptional regulator, 2-MHQ and catechol-resistance regulon repressor